jgi:pyrroloquinoline-quinone synthase
MFAKFVKPWSMDGYIRRRHLLKHPFYIAWSNGELSLGTLQDYARQYHHFESNFPRYVAGTYAHILDPKQRRVLLENLTDEEGRDPTHPELWRRFGEALGVSRKAMMDARPAAPTKRLCSEYEALTLDGSAGSGLGALYGYESIFPEVAREKSRGLRAFYGIRSPSAHEFFRVHTEADVEHSAAERRAIRSEIARSPRSARDVRQGVERSLDAWWGFLDGFVPASC